jgi:Tfp pilus assembly protein PilE
MEEIMNNHEPKKHSPEWYESEFSPDDTRYYGLYLKGKKSDQQAVLIDMRRFFEYFHGEEDNRMNLRTNKNSLLFKPSKSVASDYKVNIIKQSLSFIKKEWLDSRKRSIHPAFLI